MDAAIELGIGNKTVAKWMFSPVEEGDEEEDLEQVRVLFFTSLPVLNFTHHRHKQAQNFPTTLPPLQTNIPRPELSLNTIGINHHKAMLSMGAQHTPYSLAHPLLPHILTIPLHRPLRASFPTTNSGKRSLMVTTLTVVT